MKFVQSNLAKKLIIVLIILFLFNTAYPSISYAVDIGGILFQPLVWLLLGIIIPIDATLGAAIYAGLGSSSEASNSVLAEIQSGGKNFGSKFADYFIGPDAFFKGNLTISENFFNIVTDKNAAGYKDIFNQVKVVIARFYIILRNIAAFVLLAGLIFIGIRILLSANIPTKKTMYLTILQDWILGMAILIFSHIIMILIFDLCEAITRAVSVYFGSEGNFKWQLIKDLAWSGDSTELIVKLVMYFYLCWLTIIFLIAYLKRFFWTGILIVFAPVFAVMYAFGQQTKQMYSNWLKEFILNAFIQPFHMIIYGVLIGIPMTISKGTGWSWSTAGMFQSDCLYCLFALTMIRPAEKYMRGMFGMNKGISNMASYDSGKQTFDAVKNTIEDVAKKVVQVVGLVATGGAAGATGALGQAGQTSGALGEAGKVTGALGEASQDKPWITEGWDTDTQGRYFDPYKEEWFTENELNSGRDLPAYMDTDDFNEADREALKSGIQQALDNNSDKESAQSSLNASNITITAGQVNMQGDRNIKFAGNGQVAAIEEAKVEEKKKEEKKKEEDADAANQNDDIELLDGKSSLRDKFETFKDLGLFEEIGRTGNEAYKGLHSIADTFYVDGQAPTDWKATADRREGRIKESDEKRKADVERAKDNWAHNKVNISIMADKYMPEMRKIYQDKPEEYIRMKAEEKAKSALKDMSVFVPYGVTDVNKAYELYKDSNNYGYTPEEAIRSRAGFESFNSNTQNVFNINNSGTYQRNDYTSVTQAIPAAREYYNAGYTNVSDMAWVDQMAERLGKSPAFAIKVDEELRKKGGKINYKGNNGELKGVIDQINKHYE